MLTTASSRAGVNRPSSASRGRKMTPMPMDKSDYYKVLDELEKVRSQLISTNPRNPGLRKISTELIKIMERVVQYRDVLLGDKKMLLKPGNPWGRQ